MAVATAPTGRGRNSSQQPAAEPLPPHDLGYSLGVFLRYSDIRSGYLRRLLALALRPAGLDRLHTLRYKSQRVGVEGTSTARAKLTRGGHDQKAFSDFISLIFFFRVAL